MIVGVDGSPGSDRAVDWATDLATALGSPLRIVHAYVPWSAQYPFNLSGADAGAELEGTQHDAGEAVLQAAARRARQRGGLAPATELVAADPAAALIERSGEARLLVIGSRTGQHHGAAAGVGQPTLRPARPLPGHRRAAQMSVPTAPLVAGVLALLVILFEGGLTTRHTTCAGRQARRSPSRRSGWSPPRWSPPREYGSSPVLRG